MKLIRARFTNFRLLRDLEVPFSVDRDRNLTVFRAENETGKTTMLTALQWALYGERALPEKGQGYRLHPIDWTEEDGARAHIEVEVDFALTRYNPTRGRGTRASTRTYRIKRAVREEVSGTEWRRSSPTVHLFRLTDSGAEEVGNPDLFIADALPPELREVFFTDGDRALSFIEADLETTTKRGRVQRAIKSLLGLGLIEACEKRVKEVAKDVNRKIRDEAKDDEVQRVTEAIDRANAAIDEWSDKESDARQQHESFELKLRDIEKNIESILRRGDQEELAAQLSATTDQIDRIGRLIRDLEKTHSSLFRAKSLAGDLLGTVISDAQAQLEDMEQRNEIPSGTIPVLEECLRKEQCVCGDSLRETEADGAEKRKHIQHIIEDTRQSDQHKKILTELFYRSRGWMGEMQAREGGWIDEYERVFDQRDRAEQQREALSRRRKELEVKIDELKDTDIQELRKTRARYQQQRVRFRDELVRAETERRRLESQRAADEARRERLLKQQAKAARIIADLEATKDIEDVLRYAYERIQTEELDKVSTRMNELFIDMIGADPEQNAIIRRAEVSREFDILVYGPGDRMLNPDRDLNGASRRALTIAFILALTGVSEVEAPNTIDTPLGMMSGFVKRSVLRIAAEQSSQLVLFLTRDEIKGCEGIIDERAGEVVTLTNPAHYPRMLVHEPSVNYANVVRCECDHHKECDICERRYDEREVKGVSDQRGEV